MAQSSENHEHINVWTDAANEWRWQYRYGGNVMADSGEGYKGRDDALIGLERALGGIVKDGILARSTPSVSLAASVGVGVGFPKLVEIPITFGRPD